jgi:hypothetical protein
MSRFYHENILPDADLLQIFPNTYAPGASYPPDRSTSQAPSVNNYKLNESVNQLKVFNCTGQLSFSAAYLVSII